jgi:predicted PhzF superfamily epimerase YddE/YHI9
VRTLPIRQVDVFTDRLFVGDSPAVFRPEGAGPEGSRGARTDTICGL